MMQKMRRMRMLMIQRQAKIYNLQNLLGENYQYAEVKNGD
jgi:hypothetical protein